MRVFPLPLHNDTFSWNFKPKGPLTRAERVRELDELSCHYMRTLQKDNIMAVKAWHLQDPQEQIFPAKTVNFQNGKRIEESEINLENGEAWYEVSTMVVISCSVADSLGPSPAEHLLLKINLST